MTDFSAIVDEWVKETDQRVEAVVKQSVQELSEEMTKPTGRGGRMRVDTGFLRASLLASTSALPLINPNSRPAEGGSYSLDFGQISLTIANWKLREPIYLGFTAAYAGFREFGINGQPGDAFVRGAAMLWQNIVNRNSQALRERVTGSR